MPPQEQAPSGNTDFPPMPEVLSDEEIRARAAAYAQRIYEQQLEAYEAQRAQAMEVRRLQEEYARRQAEYEEACRAYYAQQQVQPAVRIDAETGEEIYTYQQNRYDAAQPETPAGEENREVYEEPESAVPAGDFPDGGSSVETESESYDESDVPVAEENGFTEEIEPESAPEEDPVPAAPAEAKKTVVVPVAPRFPLISVMLIVLCVAALSAEGYILFSDDPRFERQRNNFFSAIGWDNAVNTSEEAEKAEPKKAELPELRRKVEPPKPVAVPEQETEPPVPAENFSETEPAEDEEAFSDEIEDDSDNFFLDDES